MLIAQNQTVFVDDAARWIHAEVRFDRSDGTLMVRKRVPASMAPEVLFEMSGVTLTNTSGRGEFTFQGDGTDGPVMLRTRGSKKDCGCRG